MSDSRVRAGLTAAFGEQPRAEHEPPLRGGVDPTVDEADRFDDPRELAVRIHDRLREMGR